MPEVLRQWGLEEHYMCFSSSLGCRLGCHSSKRPAYILLLLKNQTALRHKAMSMTAGERPSIEAVKEKVVR